MDWLPLIIAAIVGIVIGTIAAYIPLNRRGEEYQSRIRDVEGKLRNSERDLTDVRGEAQGLQANMRTVEANYSDAQTNLRAIGEEKATLMLRADELDALKPQYEEANVRIASLNTELEDKGAELNTFRANAEAAAQALAAKEEALVANEQALAARELELEKMKFELGIASSTKADLESRLQRVRADVGTELALLTSSAIKLKDDALAEANNRITSLTHELSAFKNRGE